MEDKLLLGAIDRISLLRALRKLPRGYKKLFLLHDVIGYEHHEIAGMLAARWVVRNRSSTGLDGDCACCCKENLSRAK